MIGALFLFIFWIAFALGFYFLTLAFAGRRQHFWWAGLCFYVFSMFAAFSFGTYSLILAIICWVVAAGYSLNWLKKRRHALAAVPVGVLIWLPLVKYIDDFYLFYPLHLIP